MEKIVRSLEMLCQSFIGLPSLIILSAQNVIEFIGEKMTIPADVIEKANEWCSGFAAQIPGSFDHAEGVKCYLAGYELAQKKAEGLVEALEERLCECEEKVKCGRCEALAKYRGEN